MRNLIYIVALDHASSMHKNSDYSGYSVRTWEYWCNRNNVDLIVNKEHDERFGRPIWNKELVYEYGKKYGKIGVVDSDTMVKWDAPNIFEMFNNDEFCGVVDNANLKWIYDSVNVYKKFFPDINIDISEYYNAGILFFGNKYLAIFEDTLKFYLNNQIELDNWNLGGGKEQTILNYHLIKHSVNKKDLTLDWNMIGMHKRGLFGYNWQLNEDKTPFFIKYGKIWHFTGFSVSDRIRIMKQTWELIKDNYV